MARGWAVLPLEAAAVPTGHIAHSGRTDGAGLRVGAGGLHTYAGFDKLMLSRAFGVEIVAHHLPPLKTECVINHTLPSSWYSNDAAHRDPNALDKRSVSPGGLFRVWRFPGMTDLDAYPEEIREQIAWERELYEGIDESIKHALGLALQLWSNDYALAYVRETANQIFPKVAPPSALARPKPKPGKKVIPHKVRRQVFERDAYRCLHCGSWEDLTVDHIVPESRGGSHDLDNLQTLCRPCNSSKQTKTPEEWLG